jgi:hypothetical protein
MDTMVKKRDFWNTTKGKLFHAGLSVFCQSWQYSGDFFGGGHTALFTLFTRLSDRKTEPDSGLFFHVWDAVPKKGECWWVITLSRTALSYCFFMGNQKVLWW